MICIDGYRSNYPHETFLWLSIQKLEYQLPKFDLIRGVTPGIFSLENKLKKADNRVVLLSRIGWLNFSDQFLYFNC